MYVVRLNDFDGTSLQDGLKYNEIEHNHTISIKQRANEGLKSIVRWVEVALERSAYIVVPIGDVGKESNEPNIHLLIHALLGVSIASLDIEDIRELSRWVDTLVFERKESSDDKSFGFVGNVQLESERNEMLHGTTGGI